MASGKPDSVSRPQFSWLQKGNISIYSSHLLHADLSERDQDQRFTESLPPHSQGAPSSSSSKEGLGRAGQLADGTLMWCAGPWRDGTAPHSLHSVIRLKNPLYCPPQPMLMGFLPVEFPEQLLSSRRPRRSARGRGINQAVKLVEAPLKVKGGLGVCR